MRDTVLVTGAGGFVGSAVVRLFVKSLEHALPKFSDGAPVRHLVALLRPGASLDRLEELPRSGHWSIAYADLADRIQLRDLLLRVHPRAILHLALDRAVHRSLPERERHRLIDAPLEMLFDSLAGVPDARLIHTSSAWILRPGDKLGESAGVAPVSAYAENKLRADCLLPHLHTKTGVDWINLRLFYIFGKYENESRLLPYLVRRLSRGNVADLSPGHQVRDFNDVDVIAQAYRLALEADDNACRKVYHIGSGRGITVRSFAKAVAGVTGNASLIRFGTRQTPDQTLPCIVADPTRARRVLQWSPTSDVEAQIRTVAKWWLERTRKETGVKPHEPLPLRPPVTGQKGEGSSR